MVAYERVISSSFLKTYANSDLLDQVHVRWLSCENCPAELLWYAKILLQTIVSESTTMMYIMWS